MDKRKRRLLCMLEGEKKYKWIRGAPPLSFRAFAAGELENYRIYGNTVGGESVGDRTGNLFDGEFLQGYWAGSNGAFTSANNWICIKNKITCNPNTPYTLSFSVNSRSYGFAWYDVSGNYISSSDMAMTLPCKITAVSPNNAYSFGISIAGYPDYTSLISPEDVTDLMVVEGSTALPYEPYGYKVPVTVEGKNLLQNTATSQTINGVTFTVNADKSVTCNGTAGDSNAYFTVNTSFDIFAPNGRIISGIPSGGSETFWLQVGYIGSIYDFRNYVKNTHQSVYVQIVIHANYTCDNLTFYPMIRDASITDDTYEPYRSPVTTNLYLPEQIRKVGEEAEYIDYAEQKMHRIGADDIDVTLPALPTLPGTNVLSVGTEVQPSRVEVKGRIKAVG